MRRHHVDLMDNLLPHLAVDVDKPLANAGERRWLEIGFGGGEHLVHQAALHPDITHIGAEAYLNGVAKALAHIEEQNLANVRIHYGDARALLKSLPDVSMERIALLYPDPWPKDRQKRRRFVNADNLSQFLRILAPQGLFLFASDIPDYVEWTLEHVATHGGFQLLGNSPEPFENWVRTRYEAKAVREGRSSRYLTFRKQ